MRYPRSIIHITMVFIFAMAYSPMGMAGLIHRYSFDNGAAKDSAGTVDAATKGSGAAIAAGKLVLKFDPSSSGENIAHLAFSAPLIPKGATSATLIIWFTANEVGPFARLIDIGASEGGEGHAFFYFVPRNGEDMSRAAMTATDVGARIFVDNERLDDGKPHMAAIVINGETKKLHVSIDGKEPKPAENLDENTLDKVNQAHAYIGRSSFENDPGLSGSIDEFRVYDTALKPEEIAAIQKAGPDALPTATTKP